MLPLLRRLRQKPESPFDYENKKVSFKEAFSQIQLLIEAFPLKVLIWGPGPDGGEHLEKRRKIRGEIKFCFRHADVQFSEDLEGSVPGYGDLSIPERELWHLEACDVCVVLDTSKGAGEEIAHFVSQYGTKLIILTHEQYKDASSFPASMRKYGYQLFYSEEEYEECSVVERVLTRLRQVALEKLSHLR